MRHFIIKGKHLHLPDKRKIVKKQVLVKIKEKAIETKASSNDIISESLKHIKMASLAVMPPPKQLQHLVSRSRMDPEIKSNPKKLSELELSEKFCKLDSGEEFLLYDSGTIKNDDKSEKRLIIFGTAANLKFLKQCNNLCMDGTFTVTPKLFHQLYSIHGMLYFQCKETM